MGGSHGDSDGRESRNLISAPGARLRRLGWAGVTETQIDGNHGRLGWAGVTDLDRGPGAHVTGPDSGDSDGLESRGTRIMSDGREPWVLGLTAVTELDLGFGARVSRDSDGWESRGNQMEWRQRGLGWAGITELDHSPWAHVSRDSDGRESSGLG
jgi:hypothetical protein